MNLASLAFNKLYPNEVLDRDFIITYSGRFKDFNGNVHYTRKSAEFRLSKKWKEFSDDLKIGFIQYLLVKMYDFDYEKTFEMKHYDSFVNNLRKYAKVGKAPTFLLESFNRVNEEYFDGFMDRPNLKWGRKAYRKLGHFEYASNTVVISRVLKERVDLLDYVMYHELLHKKHGLKKSKSGKSNIHHSKEFLEEEALFRDKSVESKLKWFLRRKKISNMFFD